MSGPKREQFGQPLMRVMGDASISRTARLVYCILTGATDARTATCRMSVTTLADRLGMERKNTSRYVKELEDRGIIIRLTKTTQPARWSVPVGGVLNGYLPRQRDKLNGNLPHQRDENLPRQRDTFIDIHNKKLFSDTGHLYAPPQMAKDSDSDPPSRVITDLQEKSLIAAQEELEKKRANLGISQKASLRGKS